MSFGSKLMNELKKKVYFAGSIRGGRGQAELYQKMIAYLKKKAIVLTEHIGDLNVENKEKWLSDEDIYLQDVTWLKESDLVIAECTVPSLGVGYECAFAEAYGIRCHILYDQRQTRLSAMLSGNPYFFIHPYQDEEEVFYIIDEILRMS